MESEKSLSVPEWIFVIAMCCFLVFAAVSAYQNKQVLTPKNLPQIEIFVTGAVVEPKHLTLPHGAKLVDALAQVKTHSDAELDHLFYNAPLVNGQVVVVPKQGVISIYVSGAVVKEQVIYLPKGSRYPALLKNQELFLPEADLRFLQRKRRVLKDGEQIIIPFKHEPKKLY